MPVSCFLLAAFLASSQPSASYSGDITLPLEVYTAEGSAIPKGKSTMEIRLEGAESSLVFLSGRKTIAVVKGKQYSGAGDFSVPVAGTTLLRPPTPPKTEGEKNDDKSQVSPYLGNIDWTATLRLYRTANLASHEIHAVSRIGTRRFEFPLFSAPPTPAHPAKESKP